MPDARDFRSTGDPRIQERLCPACGNWRLEWGTSSKMTCLRCRGAEAANLKNEQLKTALEAMIYVYSGENEDCIDKMQDAWELVRATGLSVEKQPCEHQWV